MHVIIENCCGQVTYSAPFRVCVMLPNWGRARKMIHRGWFPAARRYEFYFRVVKTIFSERAQRVCKILFLTRENKIHIFEPSYNFIIDKSISRHFSPTVCVRGLVFKETVLGASSVGRVKRMFGLTTELITKGYLVTVKGFDLQWPNYL